MEAKSKVTAAMAEPSDAEPKDQGMDKHVGKRATTGKRVRIAEMDRETAIVDGIPVSEMDDIGELVEHRKYPPHVNQDDPGDMDPSPHCLVRVRDRRGEAHDVWFHAAHVQPADEED